jgi:penicillin-binding protein 1A
VLNVGSAARNIRSSHFAGLRWKRVIFNLFICMIAITIALIAVVFYHVYLDRSNLPDIGPFARFEFPAIGHVYDANGETLIELAREYRRNIKYEDIPPIVRDAMIAAEDKNFFSHNGVDYAVMPRVLSKIRIGVLAARLVTLSSQDEANGPAIFPQGGSTITQQLVRGYFLKSLTGFQYLTGQENSNRLREGVFLPRALSRMIGARSVLMMVRKVEEIRLSLWVEKEMKARFGSKRRAKEEILARYASLIHMGNGKYGFAAAAEYYFNRPLAALNVTDADQAALLAGIAKAPRHYAPNSQETGRVLRRRDQTLKLMAKNGFISADTLKEALARPISLMDQQRGMKHQNAAVVENIFEELNDRYIGLGPEDLLHGRIQIYSTVDARVQQIVNEALEYGLDLYEKRHPSAKGIIQGSVVVLKNRDASILAETGGRQFYKGRSASYSDFNRVTKSLRQYGSAMKPIVYLAAFRQGTFNLDTRVPDRPIGVPDGGMQTTKWISNYDGQFKGMISLRKALAESRNAVAIWVIEQIGIDSVLKMSMSLGVRTPLKPYVSTALGASEVKLLELANAYRTMASGILTQPYLIRKIVRPSGEVVVDNEYGGYSVDLTYDNAILLIQEGLRGVIRIPGGTGHSLDSQGFPIAIMGKTGTTNGFRDALFIGSTYGPEGITVAVRIGFDDNRTLGRKESGGRVALPVFREIMLGVYREKILGPVPAFPTQMERNINAYLEGNSVVYDEIPEEG